MCRSREEMSFSVCTTRCRQEVSKQRRERLKKEAKPAIVVLFEPQVKNVHRITVLRRFFPFHLGVLS